MINTEIIMIFPWIFQIYTIIHVGVSSCRSTTKLAPQQKPATALINETRPGEQPYLKGVPCLGYMDMYGGFLQCAYYSWFRFTLIICCLWDISLISWFRFTPLNIVSIVI